MLIEKSDFFIKCIKKEKYRESIFERIDNFNYRDLHNTSSSHLCFSNRIVEIWKFRIPHPEVNKGKSSGFRLFFYWLKEKKKIILYKIFSKKKVTKKSNIEETIEREILNIVHNEKNNRK